MADAPPPMPGAAPPPPPEDKAPTLSKAPPQGKLFPCTKCGAKVEFDPRSRTLTCPYCGHAETVGGPDEADEGVVERDFEAYLARAETGGTSTIEGRSSQVRCTGCGATVLLEDRKVTESCPFCATHLENQPESAAGMIAPESLVPFGVDLRGAREEFAKWLAGLWFAPNALKQLANLGQLSGVYVPYWTYDSMTYTRYRGQRGDDYQETEYYTEKDSNGNEVQKSRTVTRTVWYPVSGEVQHFFDDVLVCGSTSVAPKLVGGMEPWELAKLEPFRSEFLGGFKTERYAVGLKDGFEAAKEKMGPVIDGLIRRDIGGDHQRIDRKSTRHFGVTFKHCLLPVWVASYRYHETLFQILINGLTGKVSGERPYSWAKIAALVAVILLVVALVVGLVAMSSGGKKGRRAGADAPAAAVCQAATPRPHPPLAA